jgi:hypothetical protein
MKKNKIALLSFSLVIIYLVVDLFHFFIFRINPVYPTFTEAFYESTIVSCIKWAFSASIIIGLIYDRKRRDYSFYILFSAAIGILVLFVLKGQLFYLLRGSLVFKIGLLEICTIFILIYTLFALVSKYKIKTIHVISSFLVSVIVWCCLFYQLPLYNAPF